MQLRERLPVLARILLLALPLCLPAMPAQASGVASYYAPPSQSQATLQIGYNPAKYSQDYITLNQNPVIRFASATAGFHYDAEKRAILNLRAAITTGSLTSSDKDYTWTIMGPSALDIVQYDELSVMSIPAAAFDKDGVAILDGTIRIRGISGPAKIEARLYFQDNPNFITDKLLGKKSTMGLALTFTFNCVDFNMNPVDDNNKSRGDIGTIKYEMLAVKQ